MNSQAITLIEVHLKPLIEKGKDIHKLAFFVAPDTPMAKLNVVGTRYGDLKIKANEYSRKGIAYIMEEPTGKAGRGFAWVRGGSK